jgi:hypothetical protein
VVTHSIKAKQGTDDDYAYLAWLKGTNQRTAEQGIFPTSFVKRRYDPSTVMTNRRAVKVRMDPEKKKYTKRELKGLFDRSGDVERVVGMSKTGKTAIIVFHDADAAATSAKRNYAKQGGAIMQVVLGGKTSQVTKAVPSCLKNLCIWFVFAARGLSRMLAAIMRCFVRCKWFVFMVLYLAKWMLCCHVALLVFKLFGRRSKGLAAVSLMLLPLAQALDAFSTLERSSPFVVWSFDFVISAVSFLQTFQEQWITGVDLQAMFFRVLLAQLQWYGVLSSQWTERKLGALVERRSFLFFHLLLRLAIHLLEAAIALPFTGYGVPISSKLSLIGAEHQTAFRVPLWNVVEVENAGITAVVCVGCAVWWSCRQVLMVNKTKAKWRRAARGQASTADGGAVGEQEGAGGDLEEETLEETAREGGDVNGHPTGAQAVGDGGKDGVKGGKGGGKDGVQGGTQAADDAGVWLWWGWVGWQQDYRDHAPELERRRIRLRRLRRWERAQAQAQAQARVKAQAEAKALAMDPGVGVAESVTQVRMPVSGSGFRRRSQEWGGRLWENAKRRYSHAIIDYESVALQEGGVREGELTAPSATVDPDL